MIREVNKWRSGKNGSCLLVESLLVGVSFSHSNRAFAYVPAIFSAKDTFCDGYMHGC
jgi:hypothetical protein